MKDSNGGPVFPEGVSGGMTLRDYFAAKAMQAMIPNRYTSSYHNWENNDFAEEAYSIADAMLEGRDK